MVKVLYWFCRICSRLRLRWGTRFNKCCSILRWTHGFIEVYHCIMIPFMSNRLVKNYMLVGISVRQALYAWLFFSSSVVWSILCFYYRWFCMSIFAKYLFTSTRLELIYMFIKYSYTRHMIIHLIVSNGISCLIDTHYKQFSCSTTSLVNVICNVIASKCVFRHSICKCTSSMLA
jgi:hypothetical protein